jgi:hypothetical protein
MHGTTWLPQDGFHEKSSNMNLRIFHTPVNKIQVLLKSDNNRHFTQKLKVQLGYFAKFFSE